MRGQSGTRRHYVDADVAERAARQHGVVSRPQLLGLGLTEDAIDNRLRSGRLSLIHRGVYAVGHPNLTEKGRSLAAVYAAGEGAVLSHRSAAALWVLCETRNNGQVEVTATSGRVLASGVLVHQSALGSDEVSERAGIPVTTAVRTLFDLAAVGHRGEVFRAFREAEVKHLLTAQDVDLALHQRPGRRGNAAVRAVLERAGYGSGIRRSILEARFASFLRRHRFPPPARNVHMRIGALEIEADCLWRDQRLIVELDGRTFHDTAVAFEADRARDIALAAHGWTVIRVTWRHLHRDGPQLARDLRTLLRRVRG